MAHSSQHAIAFISVLAGLAERLAKADVVVSKLHCDWRSFGSWELEVQRGPAADAYGAALLRGDYDADGPDVVKFSWDGKEKLLSVSSAPTEPLTSPGPWKHLMDKAFASSEQAAAFVETYVVSWNAPA
jgi:hypothetical protein